MILDFLWRSFVRPKLVLYNTLGRTKQEFTLPRGAKTVRMYSCGPTVYGVQHIGNLSMFVFTNILRRTLEYNGFSVKQVINFTDFGHLVSDADEGEDKMTKGLERDGLALTMENMRSMGEKYAAIFLDDIRALNIDTERIIFPRASDYVPTQIAMTETLEEKGYAYRASDGVYFDTARFPNYGILGGIGEGNREGARVAASTDKRNPEDFALWKCSENELGWDSRWGKGFPGWHIECSAMIRKTLGERIDIHTGGIEHIAIHHNNEIAQSEAATGKKPLARFWLHRAHLQLDGVKFAKSEGRVVYLSDLIERGIHPLAFRYLLLTAHYRTSSNFTWEAQGAAQTAFLKLVALRRSLASETGGSVPAAFARKFRERVNDDLDTPGALAVLWETIKDTSIAKPDLRALLDEADKIFGLKLAEPDETALALLAKQGAESVALDTLPEDVRKIVEAREEARAKKDWPEADRLRDELQERGFSIKDESNGPRLFKK